MQFQVITRVPDPADNEIGNGNVCAAMEVYTRTMGSNYKRVPRATCMLGLGVPVFTLGEIVIVDNDGREIDGIARKASKWDVDYETFDTIDEAVTRARQVVTA